MSVIRHIIAAATVKSLQRTCPSCGRTQRIDKKSVKRPQTCTYCDKPMAAKK
jgi:uncharacterized protein (DUF983 family)